MDDSRANLPGSSALADKTHTRRVWIIRLPNESQTGMRFRGGMKVLQSVRIWEICCISPECLVKKVLRGLTTNLGTINCRADSGIADEIRFKQFKTSRSGLEGRKLAKVKSEVCGEGSRAK